MSNGVRIEGLKPVMRKLDKLGDPAAFRRPMSRSVHHLHRRIAKYPPKPAHSTYRRTGTLGRRWTTEVSPNGKRGIVGNNTPYGPYVQGFKRTTFHDAAGWKTIEDVAKAENDAVVGYFQAEYEARSK